MTGNDTISFIAVASTDLIGAQSRERMQREKKRTSDGVQTRATRPDDRPLSRDQALSAAPLRNEAVMTQYLANGEILLSYSVKQKAWFSSLMRLMRKSDTFTIQKRLRLDEMGALVWEHSDGRTSVLEMIEILCQRYQLHRKEAEKSLLAFFRMLGQRGLIAMNLKFPPEL